MLLLLSQCKQTEGRPGNTVLAVSPSLQARGQLGLRLGLPRLAQGTGGSFHEQAVLSWRDGAAAAEEPCSRVCSDSDSGRGGDCGHRKADAPAALLSPLLSWRCGPTGS